MASMVTRVLVTGADGFIGSALCPLLESHGIEVVKATRKTAGDLNNPIDWSALLEGVDGVVHLAARVHVLRENTCLPLERFRQVNVEATRQLAEQAAKAGVKRFVFASTIGVHGIQTNGHPFTETDTPNPCNEYAQSKWEAELMLKALAVQTSMEITTIRPPLVYGAGVKANFYMLMNAVYQRIPLPLACVKNKRDIIYVGNLVDAILRCLTHPKAAGETFVIADGETFSTPSLIRNIGKHMLRPALLLPIPVWLLNAIGIALGKTAMIHRLTDSLEVDATHLRTTLDWKPPFSFEEGLAQTVAWFIEERSSTK
jgi:nucleoside-diphosphate-sugar epimerase